MADVFKLRCAHLLPHAEFWDKQATKFHSIPEDNKGDDEGEAKATA